MRVTQIILAVGVCAAASAVSAAAKSPALQSPPAGIGGNLAEPFPSVAAQLAKNVAKASFAHKYDTVWGYLHPTYQKAISQSHWRRCQGAHPAAPASVTVTKVAVANAQKLPTNLPLLGHQNIQEIQLQVRFTRRGAGTQYAIEYTFWLKQGRKWTAVWLAEEYQALKTGKCYLNQLGQPGLY